MSIEWPRQTNEGDDSYFVRVLRAARDKYPNLSLTELYLGMCIETRLECLHPVDVREYHELGTRRIMPARDYFDQQPESRQHDREFVSRFNSSTFCPVCQTPVVS